MYDTMATATTFGVLTERVSRERIVELMAEARRFERQMFHAIALPPGSLDQLRSSTAAEIVVKGRQFGMQVAGMARLFEHQLLAGMTMPRRIHKKRRGQSEAYHRRIQKKWTKRFGVGPFGVAMNTDFFTQHQPRRSSYV